MSKVVFVGNVPYNMGEEQLIDVFKSVGEVIGFRLVFDRDTGKPKGYGFCEFADHETATSAVRNLNNFEVGGRPLRIDLADSDPLLEGKTTVRGELVDTGGGGGWHRGSNESSGSGGKDSNANSNSANSFLANLPPGQPVPPGSSAMDSISTLLATIGQREMMDVLAHMKAFVITHPDQARTLLSAHPQLAYALFQALVLNRVVDESILQRMLAATGASARVQTGGGPQGQAPPPPSASASLPPSSSLQAPTPTLAQHQQPPPVSYHHTGYPPLTGSLSGVPGVPTPPGSVPPVSMSPYTSQGPPPAQYPPYSSMSGMPPPPPSAMPPASAMFPQHQAAAAAYYAGRPGAVPTPPPGSGTPVPGVGTGSPLKSPQDPTSSHAMQVPQVPTNIPEAQRQMLLQVLNMTQDQIKLLPQADQTAILQLRAQFMPNA